MRLDDERMKRALSGPVVPVDAASMERDLHDILRRGRRRRRNRRLAMVSVGVAVVVLGSVLGPRALEALRGLGRTRPARPPAPSGIITTVVGTGVARSSGDGGLATEAAIRYPFDLAVDTAGNLYVLESGRVRRVDQSGRITTVVGPPAIGEATALTEANQLRLGRSVNALAIDAENNLYVGGGDGKHFMVNRISPSGEVTRIAGTGRPGFSGDEGPAIEANLGWVYDLAVDQEGNVYIADHDNNCIRMVDLNGVITTIAGTGEPGWSGDFGPARDARVGHPWGIALDEGGNVYFTQWPSVVRRIDAASGVITTIAGSGRAGYAGDGHTATRARLNSPEHITVDSEGNLVIEDTGNNCIRMVDLKGIITTIVGTRARGFRGDDGPARLAWLSEPSGMVLTPDGALDIADSGNNRVRRVAL